MSKTKKFDAQYFDDGGTIDGPFLSTIFDNADDIALIDDSDDLMLATFTPHNSIITAFQKVGLKDFNNRKTLQNLSFTKKHFLKVQWVIPLSVSL